MQIIFLPFAGGDHSYFYRFSKYLIPEITISPIKLKGRGENLGGTLYSSFIEMKEDILSQINIPNDEEYIIFGHSMGGMLAYELYFDLEEKLGYPASKIIISSCPPPNLINKYSNAPKHSLSNYEYMKEIIKIGGTSSDILNCPNLIDLMVPVIKKDFYNIKRYSNVENNRIIHSRLIILWGTEETKLTNIIKLWKLYNNKNIHFIMLSGTHFHLNNHIEYIANIINYR